MSCQCRRGARPLGAEEQSNGKESSFRGEPRSGASQGRVGSGRRARGACLRATLASARILTALAYSPGGRVEGADLGVAGNGVTERYVSAVLEQSEEIHGGVRKDIRVGREGLFENGRPFETYRELTVDGALARLASPRSVADGVEGSQGGSVSEPS